MTLTLRSSTVGSCGVGGVRRPSGVVWVVALLGVVTAGCGAEQPGRGGDVASDGVVVALLAADGEERWRADTVSRVVGGASSAGDAVVLEGGRGCEEAVVEVVRAGSGERLWTTAGTSDGGRASTAVAGDLVLLAYPGAVVARDVRTGDERWRTEVAIQPEVSIAASDDLVVFAPAAGDEMVPTGISGLSVATGAPRWRVGVDAHVLHLTMVGGSVVAHVSTPPPDAEGHTDVQPVPSLWGFDPDSGARRWAFDLQKHDRGVLPPVGVDGLVVASVDRGGYLEPDPSSDGFRDLGPFSTVVALDAVSGDRRWSIERAAASDGGGVSVLDAGDGVVLGTDAGDVVAWDATTGAERWRTPVTALGVGQVGGDVAVLTRFQGDEHDLIALDLSTGAERWSVEAGELGSWPLAGTTSAGGDPVVLANTEDAPSCGGD